MAEVFSNNASSTIVGAVGSTDTSITIQTADGPEFPTLSAGQFFRICAIKQSTGQLEIMKVEGHTAGSSTLSSLTRGLENTTALDLDDGDLLELRPTAGFFTSMATDDDVQEQTGNYAVDTGIADAYVVTLSPIPTAYVTGLTLRVKCINANTGASTINVNSLGAKSIKKNVSSDLEAGDILANQVIVLTYDGTNFQLVSNSLPASYDETIFDEAAGDPTLAANQAAIYSKDNGSGVSILYAKYSNGDVVRLGFDQGDQMTFYQAAAPTGWTQVTSADVNNAMLRVVNSAGGGNGGSHNPINMAPSEVPAHTHTASSNSAGNHRHTSGDGSAFMTYSAVTGWYFGDPGVPISGNNVYTAYAGTHSHTITVNNSSGPANWTPKYVDMIIASLD